MELEKIMIATLVFVDVKPDCVDRFIEITKYNHTNSRKEAGNVRFDVLQSKNDVTKFTLYEVYENEEAAALHKTTEHYNRWREEVADYMATPRTSIHTTPLAFD